MVTTKQAAKVVIEIFSDSEEERPPKRQKTATPPPKMVNHTQKNAHLKGRRRFNADLADMAALCSPSFSSNGFTVTDFRAGDDEGAINFVLGCKGALSYTICFLVSDTSDYPKGHQFFASTEDSLPAHYANVLDDIVNYRSMPMEDTIRKFLCDLEPSNLEKKGADTDDESELEDDDSVDDFALLDEDVIEVQQKSHRNVKKDKIQGDWNDVVASGYRPGFIKFGGDDFSISVSVPIVKLADVIPAQALRAWDSRLISRSQHLCLLICGSRGIYPALNPDGRYAPGVSALSFKVGLTRGYKPSTEHAREAGRSFVMLGTDAEDELRQQEEARKAQALMEEIMRRAEEQPDEPINGDLSLFAPEQEGEEEEDGRFDKFSLSTSMESLMDAIFLKVVQLRRRFKLGWAGAEALHLASERQQLGPELIFARCPKEFMEADTAERKMALNYELPHDPLEHLSPDADINLPLTAFSYLVRRLMLCTRHCLVCFNPIQTDFQALKPYVCDSKLCTYQYYSLNRGPSLEYEICHNPMGVDLLVSMAYCAAKEGVLDDPLPVGMGIRVPFPTKSVHVPNQGYSYVNNQYTALGSAKVEAPKQAVIGPDGLCQFDDLSKQQMRSSITEMIDLLPPIDQMRRHLTRKVGFGKRKPVLKECDPSVPEASWLILRWAVASCTAYIEETKPDERVRAIDESWRQFRFSVGSPDAESKFNKARDQAIATNANAATYPSLYAFHGSPMRNWHSIVRHGLWFKQIAHGRAYGHGVYFAKDPNISMGTYAAGTGATWVNSQIKPSNCVAIAEIVNLPNQFVSNNPYFVVAQTEWIMCRHLLVKGTMLPSPVPEGDNDVPLVKLDPAHPLASCYSGHGTTKKGNIQIPDPSYFIRTLLDARRSELVEEEHDDEDQAIFNYQESQAETINVEDGDMDVERSADDWQHDPAWVEKAIQQLLPPPHESSTTATMALQREFKTMIKEQAKATSLKDLGWYMPLDFNQDNLFQWIVEMHSFDPNIPIAKDLKARGVNSVVFEIRFPAMFPNSPPFFRVLRPRFLPFIQGGGGHITGGGSLCMDLLTADGWLPSYSISAILIQIKLAISNLEPRPARLSPQWELPYNPQEALEGYKRAANTHGWKVPNGLDHLVLR